MNLVRTLRVQHDAGRKVTLEILALAPATGPGGDAVGRRRLADLLRAFLYMYRPHEAREDTILFPAVRRILTPGEFEGLSERLEEDEHARFGGDGLGRFVAEAAGIETLLGIDDLARFTPR